MTKKTSTIITVAAVIVIAAFVIGSIVYNANKPKPIFTYFVSSADPDYGEMQEVVKNLSAEFEGRVIFDIRDVHTDPDQLNRFPVADTIPTLYMIDGDENINSIVTDSYDGAVLRKAIEKALAER